MPRQITLDTLTPTGINIFKEDGRVRVEANYRVQAGAEVVKAVSRDVTPFIPTSRLTSLSNSYDAIFSAIEQVELS